MNIIDRELSLWNPKTLQELYTLREGWIAVAKMRSHKPHVVETRNRLARLTNYIIKREIDAERLGALGAAA